MEDSRLTEMLRLTPFLMDGVRVEPSAFHLSGPLGESTLEPKVMALLVALSERPSEVCCRSELMDVLWPNGQGSDESLTRLVSVLRRVLKADHGMSIVTTVPKLGYRLDAIITRVVELPLNAAEASWIEPSPTEPETFATLTRPDRRRKPVRTYALGAVLAVIVIFTLLFQIRGQDVLDTTPNTKLPKPSFALQNQPGASVAVLPLENLTQDESLFILAEGMMRDLTAKLSYLTSLRVTPYHSARVLTGGLSDVAAAADNLRVRYIVTGSLTEQRGRVDLRIDLVDTELEQPVWSKRFSKTLEEFLSNQDQVIQESTTTIFFEIQAAEIVKIRAKDTHELSAYELTQKAEGEWEAYSIGAFKRILQQLHMALEMEPDNPGILSRLAIQLILGQISGFSNDPEQDMKLAQQHLERARAIAPRDPRVLLAGGVVSFMTGETQRAERLLEMSRATDPNGYNEPNTTAILGLTKCFLGKHEEGLALVQSAEARSSRNPRFGAWAFYRAICHYTKNDWIAASVALREAIDRNPNYSSPYLHLAYIECLLGNEAKGRHLYGQALNLYPKFTLSDWMISIDATKFPGTPDLSVAAMKQVAQTCLGREPS